LLRVGVVVGDGPLPAATTRVVENLWAATLL